MLTLITGASSGLGAEMARQLAARQHSLVLTARRTERLRLLRDEIVTGRPDAAVKIAALDVTDHDAVFRVFREFAPLERVIVNAGLGGTRRVGTGSDKQNVSVAMTNFVGAIVQVEAAMEQFRRQRFGQLVVVASVAASRGMRGDPAVYAATKRGLAHLAEGIRSEMIDARIPITVTTVHPGYIESEMTTDHTHAPFTVDTQAGVRAIVDGMEAGAATVFAPRWPWQAISLALRVLPLPVVSKLTRPARE